MYIYIYIYIYTGPQRLSRGEDNRAFAGVPSWVCHGVSEGYMLLTNKPPQAKHAETDPRHGTPTMARFQPPEITYTVDVGRVVHSKKEMCACA